LKKYLDHDTKHIVHDS